MFIRQPRFRDCFFHVQNILLMLSGIYSWFYPRIYAIISISQSAAEINMRRTPMHTS